MVLTRPSSISGNPVTSATSCTGTPASRSMRAVPPVEIMSAPNWLEPAGEIDHAGFVGDTDKNAFDHLFAR